jgi:hypothetical protein
VIQFVNPIWLAAGAAIIVPVILHMWNDRRGKLLRIGSVVLLTGRAQRMAWRRLVSQWLLLLVRCLLLLTLAVLLARPVFRKVAGSNGWVLMVGVGGDILSAQQAGGRVADSLVKAGWERHVFPDSNNYWEGFRVADRMAPAGVPFYIRTPGLARRFGGERPVTTREVHWEVYTAMDSVQRWVEAWRLAGDSIRVVEGLSRATGTSYSTKTVAVMAGPDSVVVVDTTVLHVAIFADAAYRQDGRYVKAAVMALRDFSRRRIEIMEGIGDVGDVLFWLSDRPMPPGMRGYRHVFQYMNGKERDVHTRVGEVEWMKEIAGSAFASDSDLARLIWRDGYGRGVLSRVGERYRFYGRLSPDWNGMVWSAAFPVLLKGLLFERPAFAEASAGRDRLVLDPQQIVPLRGGFADRDVAGLRAMVSGTGGEGKVALTADGEAESVLFWIVLFLFILERILVNGKQTT